MGPTKHKLGPARSLLEREGLTHWPDAVWLFPAGTVHRQWLREQMRAILAPPLAAGKRRTPHSQSGQQPPPHPRPATAAPSPPASVTESPGWIETPIEIPITVECEISSLLATAAAGPAEPEEDWYRLREAYTHLSLAQGFDELLCLPYLTGIELLAHQVETARKVLRQFRGLGLLSILGIGLAASKRRKLAMTLAGAGMLMLLSAACGGTPNSPASNGPVNTTVTVNASSSLGNSHSKTLNLIVE